MRRLFICDPMCVLSFGHNVTSLVYFKQFFSSVYDEVICLGARPLDAELAKEKGIVPFFSYYYEAFVPLPTKLNSEPPRPSVSPLISDVNEFLSNEDVGRLFESFVIGSKDHIFFPSVEFYGVSALMRYLTRCDEDSRPSVYLRFIGVMEGASRHYKSPLDELLGAVRSAIISGVIVRLSAETPPYADFLAARLESEVFVTPYPESVSYVPIAEKSPYLVYCAGSARRDKGFFDLVSIFSMVRRAHPCLDIHFVVQNLPDRELIHERHYVSQLYALPGVEILPAIISDKMLADVYRRAHVVLLPYDPINYKLRGSAITMESAFVGRPVLTTAGTGFSRQVEYYGLGKLCENLDEFVSAILFYYKMPVREMTILVNQARMRFRTDINGSYRAWMNEQ